jgi:uncharacterized RDD family membrane protein YckC
MFCPQCGTQIGSSVSFCFKCGADVRALPGAQPGVAPSPAAVASPTLTPPPGQRSPAVAEAAYAPAIALADFGQRAAAYIVDGFVLGLILAITNLVIDGVARGVADVVLAQMVIGYTLCWLYFLFSDALTGATLGKKVLGIRAVRGDGSALPLGSAVVRSIMKAPLPVGFLLFLVNVITVLVTKRKQAIHDMAAGTIVIDTRAQAAEARSAADAPSVVPVAAATGDAPYERVPFGHQIAEAEREFPLSKGVIWLLNLLLTPIAGAIMYYSWRSENLAAAKYANRASMISILVWLPIIIVRTMADLPDVGSGGSLGARPPAATPVRLEPGQLYKSTLVANRAGSYHFRVVADSASVISCADDGQFPAQIVIEGSTTLRGLRSTFVRPRAEGALDAPTAAGTTYHCVVVNTSAETVNAQVQFWAD